MYTCHFIEGLVYLLKSWNRVRVPW